MPPMEAMNQEYMALEHELSRRGEEREWYHSTIYAKLKRMFTNVIFKNTNVRMSGCVRWEDDKSTEWRWWVQIISLWVFLRWNLYEDETENCFRTNSFPPNLNLIPFPYFFLIKGVEDHIDCWQWWQHPKIDRRRAPI